MCVCVCVRLWNVVRGREREWGRVCALERDCATWAPITPLAEAEAGTLPRARSQWHCLPKWGQHRAMRSIVARAWRAFRVFLPRCALLLTARRVSTATNSGFCRVQYHFFSPNKFTYWWSSQTSLFAHLLWIMSPNGVNANFEILGLTKWIFR